MKRRRSIDGNAPSKVEREKEIIIKEEEVLKRKRIELSKKV